MKWIGACDGATQNGVGIAAKASFDCVSVTPGRESAGTMLRAEFDVSYATLGALMSVFYVASGMCQFGAGFVHTR